MASAMGSAMNYLESYFLKPEYVYILYGCVWCIIIAYVFWSVRKWQSSRKSGLPLPGLKTPLFSISGSLYTFPSRKQMKQCELPISAFIIQIIAAHSKLLENEKLFYFDWGRRRMIVLRKPEVVEELLKSNRLIRKSWVYELLWPWIGTGLLTSTGSKWRSRRKLLTPSFHFDILKDFLPVINNQSKILVDVLMENVDKEYIDVVPPMTLCTLDIICASTLGVEIGAQKDSDSEYVRALLRLSEAFVERMFDPYLSPDLIFRMSSLGRQFHKDIRTLHGFTLKVIRQKQAAFKDRSKEDEDSEDSYSEGRKKRKALMDLLIEHQMEHHDLTEEDIREEVDTFVFEQVKSDTVNSSPVTKTYETDMTSRVLFQSEINTRSEKGHDTTAMGLSFALYLIGLYPEVQEKLHEEMDNIYGDDTERPVTGDDIRDFRYLDCVLKESQRLYPSVTDFSREVEEDQDFCGYRIKKGDMLSVASYILHRDPTSFPNPEKFDPDRFLPDNCSGRHPFAFIPFSAGARNCIGQRFAVMEEKVVMANILRNFNLKSLDERDKVTVGVDLILRVAGPLRLKFTPRKSAHAAA